MAEKKSTRQSTSTEVIYEKLTNYIENSREKGEIRDQLLKQQFQELKTSLEVLGNTLSNDVKEIAAQHRELYTMHRDLEKKQADEIKLLLDEIQTIKSDLKIESAKKQVYFKLAGIFGAMLGGVLGVIVSVGWQLLSQVIWKK